ncbi:UDP-2,4-diacetamido-2,4,6-trideoxy-beta-L-altropyranose hydrolase [Psychromonas antarctica]|uniref:UDP-2,4-diacetamido-2,4, 6-trideoxy-beta-L-altropyranose hydrolase n=1 Tax=Psychromonas antarctica TaxID=67573 RepID=UPI001EE8F80A|nr:UDP-2,4-diacetamido-2,4,6-trideoxy-beta-L-altropyranose hydrolase [Psychromonas antarctica]MCG6202437.1 UDP-2,4-diacetamido-2,4,6-trideoxy-beta-L-altropyranose hydrolase [Psychromonas antarctica]
MQFNKSNTTQVIIRADASIYIGSGHIMRCLVLAESLKEQGFHVAFASRPQQGDMIDYIRHKGFIVHELLQPKVWLKPSHNSDYQAWLQVTWQQDAKNLIECIASADLIVVDHYGIGHKWEKEITKNLKCKLFVIDDLARKHNADLILDQTFLRDKSAYSIDCSDAVILAGSQYAIINPLFHEYRKKSIATEKIIDSHKVLLSMGGVDQPNATLAVLKSFANGVNPKPKITVLLNSQAPHYEAVREFSKQNENWVTHINFVENMAAIMSQHTLAIGAPGSTSWERACLGIPSIIVPLAENQKTISQNLESVNAVIRIDLDDIPSKCIAAYQTLINNWPDYHRVNLQICDGLGVQRVVAKIEKSLINFNKRK